MQYLRHYASPLGGILLAADGAGLTGLWFEGQRYYARGLGPAHEKSDLPALRQAAEWLDDYFAGRQPAFTPPLYLTGSSFEQEVWQLLLRVPYGGTTTYGALARALAAQRGVEHVSAQAVGGAVGRNPISLIVPCHRVLGADGSLRGYAGGLDRKAALLALERTGALPPGAFRQII